ncbi:hypothetical protein ACIBUY_03960 [Streptomyces sp. NPDC050085]|uniref:hypothetical protein n=1 Tax=Streptomyces sp. NPDC050085 TaxID=3365600 RepID=UPI0037B8F9F5
MDRIVPARHGCDAGRRRSLMSRIRTLKPEAFRSASLGRVSLSAERTFFGLFGVADDHGRYEDRPRLIAGDLWCERPGHGPNGVADDLRQLEHEGMICRYTGCDGKAYLHVINWFKHQKIDRPSAPHHPRCPAHAAAQKCKECGSAACLPPVPADDAAMASDTALVPLQLSPAHSADFESAPSAVTSPTGQLCASAADSFPSVSAVATVPATVQNTVIEARAEAILARTREDASDTREDAASGSRTQDPGSTPTGGGAAADPIPVLRTVTTPLSAEDSGEAKVTAEQLMREYLKGCAYRPPRKLLNVLGRELRDLLNEGYEAAVVRQALERWRHRELAPTALPGFVNDVLNVGPAAPAAIRGVAGRSGYTPWMNPEESEGADVWHEAVAA